MSYRDEVNDAKPDLCGGMLLRFADKAEEIAARADARIAELEQSVTVRDTEIARLETDLELARRDGEHLRLFARIRFGYAPGDYCGICIPCSEPFIGDKRATTCPKCADAAIDAARANGGEG